MPTGSEPKEDYRRAAQSARLYAHFLIIRTIIANRNHGVVMTVSEVATILRRNYRRALRDISIINQNLARHHRDLLLVGQKINVVPPDLKTIKQIMRFIRNEKIKQREQSDKINV